MPTQQSTEDIIVSYSNSIKYDKKVYSRKEKPVKTYTPEQLRKKEINRKYYLKNRDKLIKENTMNREAKKQVLKDECILLKPLFHDYEYTKKLNKYKKDMYIERKFHRAYLTPLFDWYEITGFTSPATITSESRISLWLYGNITDSWYHNPSTGNYIFMVRDNDDNLIGSVVSDTTETPTQDKDTPTFVVKPRYNPSKFVVDEETGFIKYFKNRVKINGIYYTCV